MHGGPYGPICDFLAGFEMDLIHTEYPYILGSWYSGTLGPSVSQIYYDLFPRSGQNLFILVVESIYLGSQYL